MRQIKRFAGGLRGGAGQGAGLLRQRRNQIYRQYRITISKKNGQRGNAGRLMKTQPIAAARQWSRIFFKAGSRPRSTQLSAHFNGANLPMIAEISAGFSSLKAAFDIAKGLNSAHTHVQLNEAKIELQQLILDAQTSLSKASERQAESSERIRALEREITDLKAWDAQAEKYELKEIHPGVVAYVPKAETDEAKTPHFLCANCFANRRKAFLQRTMVTPIGDVYQCACGAKAIVSHTGAQPYTMSNKIMRS